jgi:hypothetical protein
MQNVTSLVIKPTTQPETKPEEINRSDKAGELLAATLAAFEQWRSGKKRIAEPIPEELWQKIFSLEPFYSSALLRRFFSLSTKQYAAKREALFPQRPPKSTPQVDTQSQTAASPVSLCEVKIKKPNPYASEPLPSGKTLIVEFCRGDGQIMKIHSTQDSIPLLMRQFLGE